MARYRVQGPDGKIHVFEGPDDATPAQVEAFAAQTFGGMARETAPQQQAPQPSQGGGVMQQLGNLAAGAVRGAGSIGSTLMAPFDYAQQGLERLAGAPARAQSINAQRRAGITGGLQSLGADPESLAFQAGQIGGEVAGTLGVGGALGNVAMRAPGAAALMQSPAATGAAARIGAGAGRVAGGAITGGLSAGLVNPEDAGTGALIGGALPVIGGAARLVAAGAREFLGAHSGAGGAALTKAYQAGKTGGQAADDLVAHMRGAASPADVLPMVKQDLQAMKQARQAAYKAGMIDIKGDKSVLPTGDVMRAVNEAADSLRFGDMVKDERAAKAVAEIRRIVQRFAVKDKQKYHTPEGFDALKQKVYAEVIEKLPPDAANARRVAGSIHDAIKGTIQKEAKTYADVMKKYEDASNMVKEIERTFSQGGSASADTQLRKLQSLMRNNVSTNYGYRDELARKMVEAGGQDFTNALAGQMLNTAMPRGIQRATASGGAGLMAGMGMMGNPAAWPAAGALALSSSPRLLGEGAYLAGRLSNPLERLLDPASRAAPVIGAGMLGNRE